MTAAHSTHHPQEGDGQQGKILLDRSPKPAEGLADSSINGGDQLGFLINDCLPCHA